MADTGVVYNIYSMSDYLINFILRFLFFWIVSVAVIRTGPAETLFFALGMSTGFLLFDKFFGSPNSIKKQDQTILAVLAGRGRPIRKAVAARWTLRIFVYVAMFVFWMSLFTLFERKIEVSVLASMALSAVGTVILIVLARTAPKQ